MLANADLSVSNVRAAQRVPTNADDSKLVDIWYDLTASDAGTQQPVTISVRISSDDGKTFGIPAKELRGAIGAGQGVGMNKLITWNAGVDWNLQVSPNIRFEVTSAVAPTVDDGLVLIPAGYFTMGDANSDGGSDELPLHNVWVSGFHLGKFEVSTGLWNQVRTWALNASYTDLPIGNEVNASKGDSHPVHSVSWYGVVKWCNAYSEMMNLAPCYKVGEEIYRSGNSDAVACDWTANGYRLPSEAEWERAARGGLSEYRFPWSNTITHDHANYRSVLLDLNPYDASLTRGYHPVWSGNDNGNYAYTAPVGSFEANGFGLHDTTGNLIEWCWDSYSSYTSFQEIDPHGPASSDSARVIRGGGWAGDAYHSRTACRDYETAASSRNDVGFRVARTAQP